MKARLVALWRRTTARGFMAACLLVISVASSVSTGMLYSNSQKALRSSQESLRRTHVQQIQGRRLRKLTDLHFCRAINQSRKINNRDRQTFIVGRRETKAALKKIKDPVLKALLKQSLVQTARELRIRPELKLLPCVPLIEHPSSKLPPPNSGTLPPTTTG